MNNSYAAALNFSHSDVPCLINSSIDESATTCLRMIAEYHKREISSAESFSRADHLSEVDFLLELAKTSGLRGRLLKTDLRNLKFVSTPCILEWSNRYVVLCSYTKSKLVINDPISGQYSCSLKEADAQFHGNAIEINAERCLDEDSKVESGVYSFYKSISGFDRSVISILIMSLFIMMVVLTTPLIMQTIIDRVIPTGDKNLINVLMVGLIALSIMELLMRALRYTFIIHFFTKLNLQTLSNLLSHIIRMPIHFFQSRHMGDIVSRFGSLEKLNRQMSQTIPELIVDFVTSVLMITIMTFYNFKLGLIILLFLTANFFIRQQVFKSYEHFEKKGLEEHAKSATYLMETLRAIQSIKSFQKESFRLNGWIEKFVNASNRDIQKGRLNLKVDISSGALVLLENIIIIYLVANSVVDGEMTIGTMYAFLSYKIMFSIRSESFLKSFFDVKLLNTHLLRVRALTREKREKSKLEKRYQKSNFNLGLTLDNVSFKYPHQPDLILSGINFSILPGESVAIIGPSGRGKSTLLKIMMGLYRPTEGVCRLDNLDVTEIGDYQEIISAVLQEDQLVQGSIIENITWFDNAKEESFVYECAKLAAVHQEILSLPDQYDTQIGDLGSALSSGQKQRIMLARALYRKPKILFLDEATSHLDVRNETLITEKLKELRITKVVVAHRPSTILSADRIIDLSEAIPQIYPSSDYLARNSKNF